MRSKLWTGSDYIWEAFLNILDIVFDEVIIPRAVYNEIVIKGAGKYSDRAFYSKMEK